MHFHHSVSVLFELVQSRRRELLCHINLLARGADCRSGAQRGAALIAHQAAIISPSRNRDKQSLSDHTFLLRGTLCGLSQC